MSGSSESESANSCACDSDPEGSVASSHASELLESSKRSRSRPKQIQGVAWVLRGEISTNQLHADSDSADMGGDVEDEDQLSKINSQLRTETPSYGPNLVWVDLRESAAFADLLSKLSAQMSRSAC